MVMPLIVNSEGLEIPKKYANESNVTIRAPDLTIESSTFNVMVKNGVFPLIKPSSFSDIPEAELENETLKPNKVSIKKHGEESEVFEVKIH